MWIVKTLTPPLPIYQFIWKHYRKLDVCFLKLLRIRQIAIRSCIFVYLLVMLLIFAFAFTNICILFEIPQKLWMEWNLPKILCAFQLKVHIGYSYTRMGKKITEKLIIPIHSYHHNPYSSKSEFPNTS